MEWFTLKTSRESFYDITSYVKSYLHSTGVKSGICVVGSPHTTAGITINENADPHVVHDLLLALNNLVPDSPAFLHSEGNSAAHLKTSLMGNSVTIPIDNGDLVLGIWQGIYFCEFDGPRTRKFYVKIIREL